MNLFMRFPEGKKKALTLSYDDGVQQDVRFLEILNKHGIKCTFNLNSKYYETDERTYKEGQMRIDPADGCLYRVNKGQGHTSQQGWNPSLTPALWTKAADPAEEWPAWSQPICREDSYGYGAKTSHNDKRWTSDYEYNTWEPGVHGWTEVVEE